ncbi:MAG: FkbM family methyltransferase [Cyanobacteria bacterium]|nr:FkbM family methyltransferase [Cyanobacteriota bacterium]
MAFASLVLGTYRAMVRTGVMDSELARQCFRQAYFAYKRIWEDPYFNLSRRHPKLFAGGHVLDIGANVGYTSSVFASAITDNFRVYAFEPELKNFTQLQLTIDQMKLTEKIVAIESAVGASNEAIELCLNPFHPGDHRVVTPAFHAPLNAFECCIVNQVSIDFFYKEKLDPAPVKFVKIDVQGYEPAVCEGMKETIENHPGINVSFEYSPTCHVDLGFEPESLLDFFSVRRFQLFLITQKGELQPWNSTEEQLGLLKRRSYIELLATRDYRA